MIRKRFHRILMTVAMACACACGGGSGPTHTGADAASAAATDALDAVAQGRADTAAPPDSGATDAVGAGGLDADAIPGNDSGPAGNDGLATPDAGTPSLDAAPQVAADASPDTPAKADAACAPGPCDDGDPCTVGAACTGGTCKGGAPLYWQAVVGGPKDDVAHAVVALGNDVVVAGRTESAGAGGRDGWLARLGPGGAVQWQVTAGGAKADEVLALVPDGTGFVAAGSTQSAGKGARDAWLVHVDADGKVASEATLGGTANEEVYGLAALDGGFVLAGNQELAVGGAVRMWVARTGPGGKEVWSHTLGSSELDTAWDVAALPDGTLLVVGETWTGGNQHLWLVRLGGDGKELWQKVLHSDGVDTGWAVRPAAQAAGLAAGFAIAGYRELPGPGGRQMWAARLDGEGQMLWEQLYGTPGADEAKGLAVGADGGVVLAGAWNGKGATSQFGVVRTDAAGKALGTHVWGGGGAEMAHAVAAAPGGWAVAGQIGNAGAALDAWVFRLTTTGTTACGAK
ncbi:MAG: hypothetical protein EXR79_12885 [Myxococcales bacterium]|nr:hypothetical protein [Myxococcales bacterium]